MNTLPARAYGSTGRQVSVLGLGGAFIDRISTGHGIATIRRAWELGITYFDTSPGYCDGRSPAVFGQALAPQVGNHFLATKVGYLPRIQDHRSARAIRQQIEASLRSLRRDRVDAIQIHEADMAYWWSNDAQFWKGTVPETEPHQVHQLIEADRDYDFENSPVMQVLRDVKDQGLCDYIGITGNNAKAMARLFRSVDVDALLLAFNYDLIHREGLAEAIPLAAAKGAACLIGGVFDCGRLARPHPEWLKAPPPWMTPVLRQRIRKLYALQRACGLSLVEMTLRYLIADQSITGILVGATIPEEVSACVRAIEQGPLPADLHGEIDQLGASPREDHA